MGQQTQEPADTPRTPESATPSNTVILAMVATHAVIVLLIALYILFNKEPIDGSWNFIILHQVFFIVLSVTGLLTSLTSVIPQLYLLISRFHTGLDLGNLSILGTGLQALAFTALCISQCARLWFWRNDQDQSVQPPLTFWSWFAGVSGPAVSYGVLAAVQVVVSCVAMGLREGRGFGSALEV
ncbi:hypothetical protein BJX64DRAFT_291001 [Aspergillus heterothallicus]